MNELLDRFRNHTLGFWKKYDIHPVGFFTPVIADKNNQLIFMLQFRDLKHREDAWASFMADKDWLDVVAESNAKGALVVNVENKILSPTDFSPLK